MDYPLILRLREYALQQDRGIPFARASQEEVERTERRLGFALPPLLTACYVEVGNGGFGPGCGLIGLEGGFASDYGTLLQTYEALKRDQEAERKDWPVAMLPFCEWGCNIFSCVDCSDARYNVLLFEDFALWPQGFTLEQFFNGWIGGTDLLSLPLKSDAAAQIVNPFTGEKTRVIRRRWSS